MGPDVQGTVACAGLSLVAASWFTACAHDSSAIKNADGPGAFALLKRSTACCAYYTMCMYPVLDVCPG